MVQIYKILRLKSNHQFMFHMKYVIKGSGALVNEKGVEQPLKAGDFTLVNPEGRAHERSE